jgi:integrase
MVEELQRGGMAGFAQRKLSPERVFGSYSAAGGSPLCPNCNSSKVWRDGLRGQVQRWLCRSCGYRFSESKTLKSAVALSSECQICAEKAKNLGLVAEIKTVTGDIERRHTFAVTKNIDVVNEEARGLITKFMAYLEREGYDSENQYPTTLGHLVKDGANLLDPESVKTVIAQQRKKNDEPWSDSMKLLATCAYDVFCTMQEIRWKRPIYHQNEVTVPVPDEKDLDLLISAARKRMATFLLCLKETFADPAEIIRADWIDLNGDVFSINHPVKGHLPGKYQLTPRLVAMLNALPRKDKRIFPTNYKNLYACLENLRSKAANKFQNPALKQISFKSFRHWGGSMIAYYSNGNPLVIMRALRHKSFKSSLKYIHTINFKEEDFDIATATTPEEIQQLGKAGWTKYDELTFGGVHMHFYRKPKRFGGFKNMDTKNEKPVDKFLCAV